MNECARRIFILVRLIYLLLRQLKSSLPSGGLHSRSGLTSIMGLEELYERQVVLVQPEMDRGCCVTAEPASVPPGKIIVAPPRPSVSTTE